MDLKLLKSFYVTKRVILHTSVFLMIVSFLAIGGCGKTSSTTSSNSGDILVFISSPLNNSVVKFAFEIVCEEGLPVIQNDEENDDGTSFVAVARGGQEPYTLTWQVYGTYDATFESSSTSTASGTNSQAQKILFMGDGIYTIRVTAIDGIGRRGTDSIQVRVDSYLSSDERPCPEP